jgi:alpha-1,3-fucosyltransferase
VKQKTPTQASVLRSPGELKGNLNLDENFYNLTMSYRLDSDIDWFYGITVDLETGTTVAPAVHVQWKEPDNDFNGSFHAVRHFRL